MTTDTQVNLKRFSGVTTIADATISDGRS